MWASWWSVTAVALRAIEGTRETRRIRCVACVKTGRIRMSWRLGSERAVKVHRVRSTEQDAGFQKAAPAMIAMGARGTAKRSVGFERG